MVFFKFSHYWVILLLLVSFLFVCLNDILFETLSDFIHESNSSFDHKIINLVIHLAEPKKRLEDRNEDCLWENFSSVELTNEVEITKQFSFEQNCFLLSSSLLRSFFFIEELLETHFANIKYIFSEFWVFHIGNFVLLLSQIKF